QPPQRFSQRVPQTPPQPSQPARPSTSFPSPPKKRTPGRTGLVLLFLVLLVVLGIGTYAGAGLLGLHLPGFDNGSAVQPPITTMPVNATVTYASVDITILTVQQSQRFLDDPNTTTTGMVRLHFQEQNKTSMPVSWAYSNIARLILPGKKTVAPLVQARVDIAPGVTQKSTLDFAVPTSMKISQLTLRLGAANEAQMDIPLTGHADLRNYASKTVN